VAIRRHAGGGRSGAWAARCGIGSLGCACAPGELDSKAFLLHYTVHFLLHDTLP